MRSLPRRWTAAVAIGLLVPGVASCSGGSTPAAAPACTAPVQEALDASLGHVLPGAPEPTYLTDPPTSGPHRPGAATLGVVADPIDRPSQVGILEGGAVLVQHRDAADRAALRVLGGEAVVAPNPGLPARVVATAWLWKLTCDAVDVDALRAFVRDHGGHGPGTDE